MTAEQQVESLKEEVRQGSADAMVSLADLLGEQGHPHAEELRLRAELVGFEADPGLVYQAGMWFMRLVEDVSGKIPKAELF